MNIYTFEEYRDECVAAYAKWLGPANASAVDLRPGGFYDVLACQFANLRMLIQAVDDVNNACPEDEVTL